MSIADQDKAEMTKLAFEMTQLRSREAFAAALEVAYALGRRRGFAELAETIPPAPSSLSEGKGQ